MTNEPINDAPEKPEWVRVPAAVKAFGLSRSTLYELIKNGKIKSRVKKERGAINGIRLISYDSLNAHIEGWPDGKATNP